MLYEKIKDYLFDEKDISFNEQEDIANKLAILMFFYVGQTLSF